MLQAYNNDKKFKAAFVRELQAHAKADQVVQGAYGDGCRDDNFRGCSVGCGIRSLCRINKTEHPYNDHAYLAAQIQVPETLQRLNDRIFEGLTPAQARRWPVRFARAIPVGADLSRVWPAFAVWILTDAEHGARQYAKGDARKAITRVAQLYRRVARAGKVTEQEFKEAKTAANAAADAANAAANAAAYAAYAANAAADAAAYAVNAVNAANAANAAAYAVDAAAYAAYARRGWCKAAGDKLLELMSAAE